MAAGVRADSLGSWAIVDFGELKRGEARFSNMGREVLYRVYGYDGNELIPITGPFLLRKDGTVEHVEVSKANSHSLDAWRNNMIVNR